MASDEYIAKAKLIADKYGLDNYKDADDIVKTLLGPLNTAAYLKPRYELIMMVINNGVASIVQPGVVESVIDKYNIVPTKEEKESLAKRVRNLFKKDEE